MTRISKDSVAEVLTGIIDSDSGKNILEAGFVKKIHVDGATISCILDVGTANAREKEPMRAECENALKAIAGVESVQVILTAERQSPSAPAAPAANQPPPAPTPNALPGVKTIIAVASGKGGVGKSTTSVNLALALKNTGLRVGLLDLDIFGPSLPKLVGIEGQRPSLNDNDKIIPIEVLGMKVMSIGLLTKNNEAIVWRGPRVMSATNQLLKDVAWGELDVLVLDLPPGTGDVQLSLIQTVPVNGAVIVSTPQDLALIDARKGMQMFEKTNVRVLGIVENMSSFSCPKCGEVSHIFGHGGAADTAKDLGVDFLGEVPLHMDIRAFSDAGTPIVDRKPDSPQAAAYIAIAAKIKEKITLPV